MQYALCIAYILARCFFQFFPTTYIGELGISFLPYMIVSDVLCVGWILFWGMRKKTHIKKRTIRMFLFILQMFLTLTILHTIANFYTPRTSIHTNICAPTSQTGLSFVVANVLKTNKNFSGIQKMITDTDPDVVMLVEYETDQDAYLKDFFTTHYPYKNRDIHTEEYFGNMIYSKYPLDDLAPTIEQMPRRYGYVSIKKDGKEYIFYLVHTSAPISPEYYLQRNKQLDYMAESFLTHQETRNPEATVIMAGDFNLSPRSPYYTHFDAHIQPYLTNITTALPLVTTRKVWNFEFLQVHIDHIFSNTPNNVSCLQRIEIPGSDHFGYYAEIN